MGRRLDGCEEFGVHVFYMSILTSLPIASCILVLSLMAVAVFKFLMTVYVRRMLSFTFAVR